MINSKISQFIETYLKGWESGDGELSLSVTADYFSYDDPNTGTIPRSDFVAFVNAFKQAAVEMGAKENAKPFLILAIQLSMSIKQQQPFGVGGTQQALIYKEVR